MLAFKCVNMRNSQAPFGLTVGGEIVKSDFLSRLSLDIAALGYQSSNIILCNYACSKALVLIPIQSLVLLPCLLCALAQPHTSLQIPSLLSYDNKCLQAIRFSLPPLYSQYGNEEV